MVSDHRDFPFRQYVGAALIVSVVFALVLSYSINTRANESTVDGVDSAQADLGSLNRLSPGHVIAASRLVKSGKTYSLGMVLGNDEDLPGVLSHRKFKLLVYPGQGGGEAIGSNQATFFDDHLSVGLGNGSQIDGLGHVGENFVHYGGASDKSFFSHTGLKRFGIHNLPPIVTRGVLLDFAAYRKMPIAQVGDAITAEDIKGMMEAQSVSIYPGDVVLFHTGWQGRWQIDEFSAGFTGYPGLGVSGAELLAELGVVAAGSDTPGFEVYPAEKKGESNPVHVFLLKEKGIYILENMVTQELVRDSAYEFMFVLGVPRIKGAVQGIINPVAIR